MAKSNHKKKKMKQMGIGSFFKAEKEPSLWTSIDSDCQVKKNHSLSLNKSSSGKRPRNVLPKPKFINRTISETDIVVDSPNEGHKKKSILSRKDRGMSSVSNKESKHHDKGMKIVSGGGRVIVHGFRSSTSQNGNQSSDDKPTRKDGSTSKIDLTLEDDEIVNDCGILLSDDFEADEGLCTPLTNKVFKQTSKDVHAEKDISELAENIVNPRRLGEEKDALFTKIVPLVSANDNYDDVSWPREKVEIGDGSIKTGKPLRNVGLNHFLKKKDNAIESTNHTKCSERKHLPETTLRHKLGIHSNRKSDKEKSRIFSGEICEISPPENNSSSIMSAKKLTLKKKNKKRVFRLGPSGVSPVKKKQACNASFDSTEKAQRIPDTSKEEACNVIKEPDHFSNVERVKKVIFPNKKCELQSDSASQRDNNARQLTVGDNDANAVGTTNFNTTSRTGFDTAIRNSASTAIKSKPHSSLKLDRTPKGRSRFEEETNAVMKSTANSKTHMKDVSNDIEFFDDEVMLAYLVRDGKSLHDVAPKNGGMRDISSKGMSKNVDSSSKNRIKNTYPNLCFNENSKDDIEASFNEGQDVVCTDSRSDDNSNRDCFIIENRKHELEDFDHGKQDTKGNDISELRDKLQNDEPLGTDNAFNSSISILNESKENGFKCSKLLDDDAVGEKLEESFLGCLSDLDASDLMFSSATADTCSKQRDKNIENIGERAYVKENSCDDNIILNDSFSNINMDDEMDISNATLIKTTAKTVNSVLVLEVMRRERQDEANRAEKVLRLFDEETSKESICILRDDWETMDLFPGDSVYITDFNPRQQSFICLDNNSDQYLTLFPDTLVSGTTVSTGITCQRRAVLSEIFKTDGPSEPMILGTFMHDIFDHVIQDKVYDAKLLEKKASNLLTQYHYLNTLYSLDIDQKTFVTKVKELTSSLSAWAKKFLKEEPQNHDGYVDFKHGNQPHEDSDVRLSVMEVVDIEENVLCPSLGIKGKIDASMNVRIHRREHKQSSKQVGSETCFLPFEMKTGKMFSKLGSIEHRAQVILYALMMSEKYEFDADVGLLYYMRTGHLQGVPATRKEKRSLIIKRNELARYLSKDNQKNGLSMPGLLKDARTCKRCPALRTCMIYHKTVEYGTEDTSGIAELFSEITDHLTEKEMNCFQKWHRLIMLEAREESLSNGERKMWMKTSEERETNQKCFSKVVLKKEDNKGDDMWEYTFGKNDLISGNIDLSGINISAGDRVVISEENCKTFGNSTGYVQFVSQHQVCVRCQEKLRTRRGLYSTSFRIEKDESLTSYKIPLANVMKLFSSRSENDAHLRDLIVNQMPPAFSWFDCKMLLNNGKTESKVESGVNMSTYERDGQNYFIKDSQLRQIESVYGRLNPDQQRAVDQCLSAKDYVMILGMPGTGKTTSIACIVNILVALGKSVLIASYTHTAVDNILLKLKEMNLDFVRLGQKSKIHAEIQPYIVENLTNGMTTVHELERFYSTKNIVATTCLGVNHPLLLKKRFDYCIVDEASQITQPVCFGAIRCADVFVLVGDHYQLPPLVQSVEAKQAGMDISLFKLLSEKHPSAVVSLRYQYRMHKDIMSLANTLIYGCRMQCGTSKVGCEFQEMPGFQKRLPHFKDSGCVETTLSTIIDPKKPVVFVDTDAASCSEELAGNHICNEKEAALVGQMLTGLITCGVNARDIGIISPYRNQLKVMEQSLKGFASDDEIRDVEINTIDKYQGRDKSCIIVSFVRSNEAGNIGELLKDWRRINVAVTRAKRKLIMIGSKRTLSYSPVLRRLLEFVTENEWLVTLPKNYFSGEDKVSVFRELNETLLENIFA